MWKKLLIDGLTCWDIGKDTILKKHDDNLHDIYAANPIDISLAIAPGYYWEEVNNANLELPSGIYRYEKVDYSYRLVETQLQERECFIELSVTKELISDFNKFVQKKHIYAELKVPYRRGVLLFGPPGTGKTFVVNNILKTLPNTECIIIFANRALKLSLVSELKNDDRLKIIVFEEFTNSVGTSVDDYLCDEEVLDFMDGEASLNNVFIIATTNYPQKLPKNIADRPGRIDKFYKIGYLEKTDIEKYLQYYKLPPEKALLDKKDLTIAHLKELVLLVKRDNITFQQALQLLDNHRALVKSSFKDFDDDDELGKNIL